MLTQVDLVGYAAAMVSVCASIPQIIRVIKTKHAGDLSYLMIVLFIVQGFLWLAYGSMLGLVPAILVNVVFIGEQGFLLYLKLKYTKSTHQVPITTKSL